MTLSFIRAGGECGFVCVAKRVCMSGGIDFQVDLVVISRYPAMEN